MAFYNCQWTRSKFLRFSEILFALKVFLLLFVIHICHMPAAGHPQSGFRLGSNELRSAPSAIVVRKLLQPGQELIFSNSESSNSVESFTDAPNTGGTYPVFVNNVPVYPTLPPFLPRATTPSPEFLACIQRCPTTSEYNPICASNRQMYGNEQKFNCARRCGANIQIVRRGSCADLTKPPRA
uniref:Uncharacterized protein n=1 Tax=Musca domestica TaxID=7370 RepID=A0A1I8ND39_MUSDO